MLSIYILNLSLHILTLCRPSCADATLSVPSAQLLPDGFHALGDFEVLSARQEGDEDIVHIRKRADEDCTSDCLDYSGWTDDGHMQCENEHDDVADTLKKRLLLAKRSRKKAKVCANFDLNGVTMKGFDLFSPTWPNPGELEAAYKMVYDIGDPTDPLKPEWFELKRRNKMWTKDLVGRTSGKKKGASQDRCYAAEHVLEWQMLQTFIEDDKDKGDNSRCAFLYTYFQDSLQMPSGGYKVQVAKDSGKLTNDHFDYEEKDYAYQRWKVGARKTPRAIDWIGSQWPGKATGEPPNPWEYELVVLNQDANNKKADLWADNKLFIEPKREGNKVKEIKDNNGNIEWLLENLYYDLGTTSMKLWPDNMGTCKAIHQFMTLMSLVQYHNDPYVREVMRAQVNRVGEAWEFLEEKVLPNTKFSPGVPAFQERGLKKEWLEWMKERHKAQLEGLTKALKDKVVVFETKFTTKVKRWDYDRIFSRANDDPPNCGIEKDGKRIEQRVKVMLKAYKDMKQVDSELKLD